MQKFDTIAKPQRLTDQIAQVLATRIRDGQFLPGERLPTEKDMAELFGVSRSVVREAVSMLKYDGLVETRQGSGVFVNSNPNTRSFRIECGLLGGPADLRAVFELRGIVESAAAGDPKAAGKAMRRHIENAMRRLGLDIEEKLEE